jgi:hypothetical protein
MAWGYMRKKIITTIVAVGVLASSFAIAGHVRATYNYRDYNDFNAYDRYWFGWNEYWTTPYPYTPPPMGYYYGNYGNYNYGNYYGNYPMPNYNTYDYSSSYYSGAHVDSWWRPFKLYDPFADPRNSYYTRQMFGDHYPYF